MATYEIKMPKLGESVTEGTIVSWTVKPGDKVKEDDILFEVTTEKINAEIPSPVEGTVLKILSREGDVVHIGTVIAIIQLDDSDENELQIDNTTKEKPTTIEPEVKASAPLHVEVQELTEKEKPAEPLKNKPTQEDKVNKEDKNEEYRWYSPVVLHLAKEADISTEELDAISGTGYLGRLSKKDLNKYLLQKKQKATTPIAKASSDTESKPLEPIQQKTVSASIPSTKYDDNTVTKDMDAIGRIIADRMVLSKKTSAHVTTVVEVDVTRLVNWRNKNKDAFLKQEGISLSYMPPIVEATTRALKEFPKMNSSVDGYQYILKKEINIGIAVSLDDYNLIVPVVHGADKLSLSGLALAINKVASKARANKLTFDDIQGGTFTITNFGSYGNIMGTPIINQPEVGILGVGSIQKKPAVIETSEGDVIAIRHKMYLSLSYDHRIINGALAGAFLKRIADYLTNWEVQ